MEPVVLALVIVLVVAVVAIAAYSSHKAALARRAAMAALAAELNMGFDPGQRRDFDKRYRQFELFRRGHTRRALNTLTGAFAIDGRDFPAVMGDYTYAVTTSNGKSTTTTTYNASYIILHAPFAGLPTLLIRPETFGDKIAGAIGFDDIDFESAEFSRRFFVKSSDKRFAYDVVTPRMMDFLLARRAPALDISQGALCLVDGTRRWSPGEFKTKLAFLHEFFDLWPDHVLADLDARNAPQPNADLER